MERVAAGTNVRVNGDHVTLYCGACGANITATTVTTGSGPTTAINEPCGCPAAVSFDAARSSFSFDASAQ